MSNVKKYFYNAWLLAKYKIIGKYFKAKRVKIYFKDNIIFINDVFKGPSGLSGTIIKFGKSLKYVGRDHV